MLTPAVPTLPEIISVEHPRARAPARCTVSIALSLFVWLVAFCIPTPLYAAFGLTTATDYYQVDTGSSPSLVFKIRRTDNGSSTQSAGDIMSLIYGGVEYQDQSRGSQINSGFDWVYTTTSVVSVDATTIGTDYLKITVTAGDLTHYYMAHKGDPCIYMATYFTTEPNGQALCRFIMRIQVASLSNGPTPSDIRNTDTTIESGDIFGFSSTNANTAVIGQTRSKHYSGIRLKDWSYIGANNNAVNPTAGLWIVRDNQEGSSGGPFYKSLLNQCTSTNQEITYIVNYGEAQTESFRTGILNSYTLSFTNGAAPGGVNTSWFGGMGLTGYVGPSGRGSVTCAGISNRDLTYPYTVGFANSTAQYFTDASAADGSFTMAGMLPGTYTMRVYKNELSVYSDASVTVTAGGTTVLNPIALTGDPSSTVPLWRIGNWDGTPNEFLNGDKISQMHPSDIRISTWGPGTYVIGTSAPATGMPCYQWKNVAGGSQAITFTLTASQIAASTVKVGITTAYAGGRPNISVNSWTSALQAASTQPDSRTLTVGSYRGNNTTYSFSVPASALIVGSNTLNIYPISGSSGAAFLSPGYSLDCIEFYQGTAQTLAVPLSPLNLTARGGDSQVALGWSAVSGAATYNVLRATVSGGPYTPIAGAVTGTSYTDMGLTNGRTYYYLVTASNSSGTGLPSNEVSAAAIPPGPPDAPTGLSATAYNASVSLTWNAAFTATSYKVKRSTTSGSGYNTVKTVTTLSYADFGLANGTTYYYVVSAINGPGEGANSAEVSVTPSAGTTVTFTSTAALDGYISANSGNTTGSSVTSTGTVRTGDSSTKRQYKGIFSFDTSSIPDDAIIQSATLKLRRASLNGASPFTALGTCYADIKGGTGFNGSTALEAADFQAAADALQVATMSNAASDGALSTGVLSTTGLGFLNKTGTTQLRVYFSTATNNDSVSDYLSWYAGDDATSANQPVLEVTYATGAAPSSLPVVSLPFDESSGTVAADATGNGWTGTLINGPTWAAGKVNNAVRLDGSNDYVTLPTGVVSSLNDFTISAWVNLTSVTSWARVFDFSTSSSNFMFLTPMNATTGTVRFGIRTPSVTQQYIDGTAPLAGGSWTHVAVTLSGSIGRLYVDGLLVGTNSAMSLKPSSLGSTTVNSIGKSYSSADPYLNGLVDEFQIYNHALTPAEVALLAAPPAAPSGLAAAVGDGQVVLSWSAVSGTVTGYNVKRGTASGGPYTTIASGITSTSYTDLSLANGSTYFYLVSTLNGVAEGANTLPVSVTPLASPAGLSATTFNKSIALSWSAAAGAASYNVKRSTVSGGSFTAVAGGVAATSYSDSTAVAGTNYFYVVSGVNVSGESANSTQISIVASPAAPPGLTALPGNALVSLSWNTSAGSASYNVLRSETNGTGYTELATGITATTFNDSLAINGTTFYYVVSATNAGGESAWSAQASARPTAPISAQELQVPPMTLVGSNAGFTMKSSVIGHAYQLQYSDDLSTGSWQNLGSPQDGTGADLQFGVSVSPSVPRRFFRIRVQQ